MGTPDLFQIIRNNTKPIGKRPARDSSVAWAAIAAVALLTAPAAKAQTVEPMLYQWLNQKMMTGDWGGLRPALVDRGIDLRASYVNEFADAFSGGERQGNGEAQQFAYGVDADLGKLAGLDGTVFHLTFNSRQGRSASADFIGNKVSVQEIYGGGETTRIAELSLEQALDSNFISLKMGFYPMGTEFAFTPLLCDFENNSFCSHPANLTKSSGWSNNPTGKWGGRVRLNISPDLYAQAGVFDVNPSYNAHDSGLKMSLDGSTGAIFVFEAGYTTALGMAQLPGHYKIGGYYDTSSVADAVVPGQIDKGRYGMYLLGDQMILSFDGTPKRGLVALGQFSYSDCRTSVFTQIIGAELIALGPFDARPNDFIDIGYARAGINHRNITAEYTKQATDDLSEESLSGGEEVIEAGYGMAATPWLTIQPNFQYIINPGAFAYTHYPNAWVFGIKTNATF